MVVILQWKVEREEERRKGLCTVKGLSYARLYPHSLAPPSFYHCVVNTSNGYSLLFTSLIPRPSHCPVYMYDYLQYAKTEGEGLVHFIM